MRRAIILSTLIVMLMAVAGVTVAQERTPAPLEVTTIPETTAIPKETTLAPEEDESDNAKDTVAEKPGKDETLRPETTKDEPTEDESDDRDEGEKTEDRDEADESDKPDAADEATVKLAKGKPVGGGNSEAKKSKKSENAGGKKAEAKPAKKSVKGGGSKAGKVTVCHKGKKTLRVGAPAEGAHVRHGDTVGACG
jgi:type IV secretory pathway VirB10-like protein